MKMSPPLQQFLTRFSNTWLGKQILRIGALTIVPRHRIGVAVVAFNEADEVLLLRHVFQHEGREWGLPGGWLSAGESPIEGGMRELKEETGLSAVPHSIVYSVRKQRHIAMSVLVSLVEGDIILSSEIYEAKWTNLHALPERLQDFARNSIAAAFEQRQILLSAGAITA